jgi:hypothetical protein
MRWLIPLLAVVLAGCTTAVPAAALLAAEGAGVVVFGRGIVDIGVSAISGRDCSIVRLDKGQTYCASTDPPAPERFCTRTLAAVDCWADTSVVASSATVADTPPASAAQQRYRRARWPKSLAIE